MAKSEPTPSILFLCDYQAPYGGNFIASLLRLDDALQERRVKTAYLFPAGARERAWCAAMQARGMRTLFLPDGGVRTRMVPLLRTIDATGATILHVHFGLFPLAELAALLRPRLRLILHFHSDFSGGRAPSVARRIKELLARVPEGLIGRRRLQKITVSEGSARTTRDCIALHNALAQTRLTDETRARGETRRLYDVRDEDTLLLIFGWSPWIKGVDIAAEAVRLLHAQGHDSFVLGIVCGREYVPEKMRAFLALKTGCTGEEPYLRFLPPIEDVFSYHKASDVMISASRSETFSYALLEAIATGRACVCSDIPGVRWASAFDTVSFVPPENAEALAGALLIADAERQSTEAEERLAAAARRAREEYGIEGWISGMLDIYGVA